jgi:hypothetical protein
MGSVLVFRAVRGIAEGLCASRKLTHVRSFARMTSEVRFQVFQARIRFVAAVILHRRTVFLKISGKEQETTKQNTEFIQCICVVFLQCGGACGRPACTEP